MVKVKDKAIPVQAWAGPEGSRRLKAPRFQDNRHMKVATLSTLHTGHLHSPGNIPGTHLELDSTPGPWCGQKDYVHDVKLCPKIILHSF